LALKDIPEPLDWSPSWYWGWQFGMCVMEYVELAQHPRGQILKAAKKELEAFEKKEREFRNALKRERAAELRTPMIKQELLRT
jgi:hypothetical protein